MARSPSPPSLLRNVPVPIWLINRPTAARPPPTTTRSLPHTLLSPHCCLPACPSVPVEDEGRGRKKEKGNGVAGLFPGGARAPVPPRRRQLPRGPVRRRRHPRRPRELHHQRRHPLLRRLAPGQGHLVRPAQRRRPRRQRWCLRVQAHQPVPVHVHGLLRQPAHLQGRQGLRILLQDPLHKGPFLLRADGDGDHHRHELLPGVQVPLRPQRHRVRPPRQARPQRQAPPLRHHRHRVPEGAVRVPWPEDRVPRGGVLQPRVPGPAGGVRGRRRRRGAGGPDGVQDGPRPADGPVDADARVLGLRLAPRLQPPPAGALHHPHPQRVRQDAHRQERHPGQLEAQHILPLLRPVQLIGRSSERVPAIGAGTLYSRPSPPPLLPSPLDYYHHIHTVLAASTEKGTASRPWGVRVSGHRSCWVCVVHHGVWEESLGAGLLLLGGASSQRSCVLGQ